MDILFSQVGIISFWLPLLAAIVAGIIILLIQQLFKSPQPAQSQPPQSFKQVNERIQNIIVIKHVSKQANTKKETSTEDAQNTFAAFGSMLIIASVLYGQYESQVITTLLGLTTFISTLWVFTLVYAYTQHIIHGKGWLTFLLCSFGFIAGTLWSIHLLSNPLFVPEVNDVHLAGMTAFFATAYKVLGIGFTLGGLSIILLTLFHYILQISVITHGQPWTITRWFLRLTRICTQPLLIGAILIILLILSCLFTSGYFHQVSFNR